MKNLGKETQRSVTPTELEELLNSIALSGNAKPERLIEIKERLEKRLEREAKRKLERRGKH